MTYLGQHIRIRLRDDRAIAPSDTQRRIMARTVLGIAERMPLLCFGLADTHLHVESLGDEALGNEIARRIGCSLRRRLRLPVGFRALSPRPIKDIWHLGQCFKYIQTQAAHHSLAWKYWYEATSLPDILSLRPIGGILALRMREHLPRLRPADLLSWLGVSTLRLAQDGQHETAFEEVREAVLATSALPSLGGRSSEVLALRRAAMELLGRGRTRNELASILGIAVRSVTRLREVAHSPELVRAIRLNLGLRAELRRRQSEGSPAKNHLAIEGR